MRDYRNIDFYLTQREQDVLQILWDADCGLISSEVVRRKEELTINTVQAIMRKLLSRNLIEVSEIVHSRTVLCRKYVPVMSQKEFEFLHIAKQIEDLGRFGITTKGFVEQYNDYMEKLNRSMQ